jgi:hypothetical protein
MKAYGGLDVQILVLLTSALVGGEGSASRPWPFILGERAPGTHYIGGWVEPGAHLYDMERWKFLTLWGLELRPLCGPAYRRRYIDYATAASCYTKLYSTVMNFKILQTLK